MQLLELSLTKYREFLNPYHHTVLSALRAIASELRQAGETEKAKARDKEVAELQETLDAASKKLEERGKKAAEPPKRVWMD